MYSILRDTYNLLGKINLKINDVLIPFLIKFKMINLLCLLMILNVKKIRSIRPKSKIKYKVFVLSKSGGNEDLIYSQNKYNKNILYFHLPRSFITQIYQTFFGTKNTQKNKNIKKNYINFLISLLKILKEKYKINAFIGFNFNFIVEIDLHIACNYLKIPFLLLYKESVLTRSERKYLQYYLKKKEVKFNGYKVAVYSNYAKNIFSKSNFVNKDKIKVIGCSRLGESFTYKSKIPKNQILYYEIQNDRGLPHRFVKQFSNNFFKNLDCHKNYNLKYNWNFLHHKTLKTLKKYAINNPKTVIIIKIKTGNLHNTNQYLNLPKNIKLRFYGVGHQLLENSKVVIGWNTTAILEGIAANRFILLPYFDSKIYNLKKENELMTKLKSENYGHSEKDFYKKLDFFMKKKYEKKKNYNSQYPLKYHLSNADNKAGYRLDRFLNENISFKN